MVQSCGWRKSPSEEFARQLTNMTKELEEEKCKTEKLFIVVEKLTQKQIQDIDALTQHADD